jgi:hypothetical protein
MPRKRSPGKRVTKKSATGSGTPLIRRKRLDHRLEAAIAKITAKRPRTVLAHILQHGFVTTEQLKELYGYAHAPRAARDVREAGIPLETFRAVGKDKRPIAAYRLGNPAQIQANRFQGRSTFSKAFKNQLLERDGARCAICSTQYEARYLQIDHRIPYEVAGDAKGAPKLAEHMLLCGSCQRSKSWSCEHCSNWIEGHLQPTCNLCYWSGNEGYEHVALRYERQLTLKWVAEDAVAYDRLAEAATAAGSNIDTLAKQLIIRALGETDYAAAPREFLYSKPTASGRSKGSKRPARGEK